MRPPLVGTSALTGPSSAPRPATKRPAPLASTSAASQIPVRTSSSSRAGVGARSGALTGLTIVAIVRAPSLKRTAHVALRPSAASEVKGR